MWLCHALSALTKVFVTVSDPRNLGPVIPRLYAGVRPKAMCPPFVGFAALVVLLQFVPINCDGPSNASSPSPISFQPSDNWDGNDGAWSSFAVQIGTPPQAVRLLPSITGNSIWTVWSYGCGESDGSDCPSLRGNLFDISASSTWEDQGNYSLPLNPEHYLPYTGAADVGFDDITLDWQGRGGPSLKHQVVEAFVSVDFYVGSLGLSPQSINITSLNDHYPSIIGSLRQQGLIQSTSWGYLAGASYYSYPVSAFGSLTFGGFDTSRFNKSSNLTLAGGSDPYRPFLLGIESITSGGKPLLSEPIITALDSLATQIWLPVSACKAFESAFGLVWNDTYQLYLLDDFQHSALVAENASVTFTLSTGNRNSSDRLNITLPYAAFDLKASPPLAGNQTVHYFPLKQAANETQYTLGRTFLQEVYVLADYDHGVITLYQALYPDSSVKSNIVAICPPNSKTCNPSSNPPKISTGAIVGIVIGAIVIIVCVGIGIGIGICNKMRRKKQRPVSTATDGTSFTGPETLKPELEGTQIPIDYRDETQKPELASGSTSPPQMPNNDPSLTRNGRGHGSGPRLSESGGTTVHEMPERYIPPELEGDRAVHELPGSSYWPANDQRGLNLAEQRDRFL